MSDTDLQNKSLTATDPNTLNHAPYGEAAKDSKQLGQSTDAPLVDMALQQVAEQQNGIGATVGEDIAALRAELKSLSQRAGDLSGDLVTSAKAGVDTAARSVRDIVRNRPMESLGLALTLGFLAGLRARQ